MENKKIILKNKCEAFELLGKTAKYIKSTKMDDDTLSGLYRAMASLLKDIEEEIPEIEESHPNMKEFMEILRKCY